MKAKLFLDFDGVLFDTVKEAYVVNQFTTGVSERISDIDFDSSHYARFKSLRYLIGPASDYYYLNLLLKNHETDDVELQFRSLKLHSKTASKEFQQDFFHQREKIKNTEYAEWLKLNTPFPFFLDIRELMAEYSNDIAIVSTKDKNTIKDILEINGVFLLPEIFGALDYDHYGTKRQLILSIIEKESIKSALFIDDSAQHLKDCSGISNLKLAQPSWGYLSPGDIGEDEDAVIKKIMINLSLQKNAGRCGDKHVWN